jgi:chaperone protein EcpD
VNGSQTYRNETGGMVPPRGTAVISVPKMDSVHGAAKVHYTAINDYGGALTGDAQVHE